MDPRSKFLEERTHELKQIEDDTELHQLTRQWFNRANAFKYSYHFDWMGRPIIQYPQDIVAMQEIIWQVRPDLIIETGVAHGGSLIFSASLLALLDYCDAAQKGEAVNTVNPARMVLGIDIDIRAHNRKEIEKHPLSSRIHMIQGSSTAPEVVKSVREFASEYKKILVCLDSNHTHEHVAGELEAYADLVSPGSYCVVFDTVIEDLPESTVPDRPWGKGNNPKTAVFEFLGKNSNFHIDRTIDNKLLITVAPQGYLVRMK